MLPCKRNLTTTIDLLIWVRIGKVVPEQFLLSKLYREKYMVQVQK